jgi:hypothetical protein
MDQPQTRPGEIARIAKIANGDPVEFRMEVLLLLNSNIESVKRVEASVKRVEDRQQDHEELDTERFGSINEKLPGVVSGVGDFRKIEAQASGAKKLLVGTIAALTALGGFVYFLVWLAKEIKP